MIILHPNQLRELRKAGLLPYPTAREKLNARKRNAELLQVLTKPTRKQRKAGDRLKRWLATPKATHKD